MMTQAEENKVEEPEVDDNQELPVESEDTAEEETEIVEEDTNTDDEVETEDSGDDKPEETEETEDVISVDGESITQEKGPETRRMRTLRKANKGHVRNLKEKDELIATLTRERDAATGVLDKPNTLDEKPTLDSAEYDTEVYVKKLDAWYEQKHKVDSEQRVKNAQQEKDNLVWQDKIKVHEDAKSAIKVDDMEEVQQLVEQGLNETQRALLIHVSDNSAIVELALGRNPKRLEALAEFTDNALFVKELGKFERLIKVESRKKPVTSPERAVKSGSGSMNTSSVAMDKLRERAAVTGDYTAVLAHKRKMKES